MKAITIIATIAAARAFKRRLALAASGALMRPMPCGFWRGLYGLNPRLQWIGTLADRGNHQCCAWQHRHHQQWWCWKASVDELCAMRFNRRHEYVSNRPRMSLVQVENLAPDIVGAQGREACQGARGLTTEAAEKCKLPHIAKLQGASHDRKYAAGFGDAFEPRCDVTPSPRISSPSMIMSPRLMPIRKPDRIAKTDIASCWRHFRFAPTDIKRRDFVFASIVGARVTL
jgi:hypothetical protein